MSVILSAAKFTYFLGHGPAVLGSHYKWIAPDGGVWHDGGAERNGEGAFASGLPYNTLGVALWTPGTLKGWFEVTSEAIGVKFITRHVDIGPHSVMDLTASMAFFLFTKPNHVPDPPTYWSARYLGRDLTVPNVLTRLKTGETIPIPETL